MPASWIGRKVPVSTWSCNVSIRLTSSAFPSAVVTDTPRRPTGRASRSMGADPTTVRTDRDRRRSDARIDSPVSIETIGSLTHRRLRLRNEALGDPPREQSETEHEESEDNEENDVVDPRIVEREIQEDESQ